MFGAYALESGDDYPGFTEKVSYGVTLAQAERGILICGTGVVDCIADDKVPGIRACPCDDIYSSHQGREHDRYEHPLPGVQSGRS